MSEKIPELVMVPQGMAWGRWAERKLTDQERQIALLNQNIIILNKAVESLRIQIASGL